MTASTLLSGYLNDTKKSEDKPKTTNTQPVETIKRRHSFNSMMKFLNSRKNLFTISESSEDPIISSSFTAGASPTKPTQRKTRKGKKKSVVQKSLATALSIVAQRSSRSVAKNNNYNLDNDSNHTSVTGTEALKDASTVSTLTVSLESSQNSINTCSTASLTSADDDDSVYAKRQAKERASKARRRRSKTPSKKKRAGTNLLLPKEPPLIRGEMRWGESSNFRVLSEEDYHYAGIRSSRKMTRDVAPVMPVRSRD